MSAFFGHGSRYSGDHGAPARIKVLLEPGQAATDESARMVLWAVVVAAWLVFTALLRDPLYDEVAVLCSTLLLACTIGFARWKTAPESSALRFLGFFAFMQAFISTGMNIVQTVDKSTLGFAPTEAAFSFAITSSLVFTIAFMAGAAVFGGRIKAPAVVDENDPGLRTPFLVALATACTLVNVLFTLYGTQEGSPLSRFGTLPIVLLNPGLIVPYVTASSLLQERRYLPIGILVLGHAGLTLLNSSIGATVNIIRDVLFTHVLLRRPLPRRLLVLTIGLVLVLNPAKHIFRQELNSQSKATSASSITEAATLWAEALETTWTTKEHSDDDTARSLSSTPRRLDYNWVAAHIYTMVPNTLPFENGSTYEDIPFVLMPRFLMPDKATSGGYTRSRWTVKLGMQTWDGATTTAIAIPAAGEAYWNFGWPGVIAIPFLLGLFAGAMLHLSPADPVGRAGYIVLLVNGLGVSLDMLVWLVPNFVAVGIAAVLVRLFQRLGQRRAPEHHRALA